MPVLNAPAFYANRLAPSRMCGRDAILGKRGKASFGCRGAY